MHKRKRDCTRAIFFIFELNLIGSILNFFFFAKMFDEILYSLIAVTK